LTAPSPQPKVVRRSEEADLSKPDDVRRLQHQLSIAQQITHIGSWEWDVASNVVTWSDELYRIYGYDPQSFEVKLERFLERVHPDDRERVQSEVGAALGRPGRFGWRERILRPDGSIRHLDTVGETRFDEGGRVAGLIGTCRDITDEVRARTLRDAEHQILESIATGAPLHDVLTKIVLMIEEHAPPTIGSILLLSDDGQRVKHGAAPHLPDDYNRAVDGQPIGAQAGSCGTAAFARKAVFVDDIETDPLWAPYRDAARAAGLRACWSTPIFGADERVLGTFALYYREPRKATQEELDLIGRATHVAGIAIHRQQSDDRLRALGAHIERVREEERTRLARELHDELGQALTALKLDMKWVERHFGTRDACLARLEEMSTFTDHMIDTMRRIASDLRPGVLDVLGLAAAIEWQAQEFQRRTTTTCIVHSDMGDAKLEQDLSTQVFRIFQEALTNVARHAQASLVDVDLRCSGGRLILSVRDDGRGMPPDAVARRSSLGLLGITERAHRLGGALELTTPSGGGTKVVLDVPLRASSA
jgi:PAS domain S-box-containing protein